MVKPSGGVPHAIHFPRIRHCLSLAIKQVFAKIPSNTDYLLSEVPKWFSRSTFRREILCQLFKIMDGAKGRKGMPSPFKKIFKMCWLCRGKVIYNIPLNYAELQAYFKIAEQTADREARLDVRLIKRVLYDETARLCLNFLAPIVAEFEALD